MITFFQPALPLYRIKFFDILASNYPPGFFVLYYSESKLNALSESVSFTHKSLPAIRKLFYVFEWQVGVIKVIRSLNSSDLIVLSAQPRCLSNVIALLYCKIVKKKVLVWGHYWTSTSKKRNLFLRHFFYKLADESIFYTRCEFIGAKIGGFLSFNKSFSSNGLDHDMISRLRAPYSAAERLRSIVFIGRVNKKSNLDLLVRAMALLSDLSIEVHVIGDGDELPSLRLLAVSLAVQKNFTFHGALHREYEIADIMNRSLFFVYPGSVGLSLIHAFSYGLPGLVHSSRLLQMPEICAFVPGVNGENFTYDSHESLAVKIRMLVDKSNNEILDRFSCNALSTSSEYSAKRMAESFSTIINRYGVG